MGDRCCDMDGVNSLIAAASRHSHKFRQSTPCYAVPWSDGRNGEVLGVCNPTLACSAPKTEATAQLVPVSKHTAAAACVPYVKLP